MDPPAHSERTAKRTAAVGIGAVLASVLLVATASIASTYTAQRVASNARALHWANSSLGTAAIARASVGQAVFFAVDRDLGVASDEAVASAVDVARTDVAVLSGLTDGSTDSAYRPPAELISFVAEFSENATATLNLIEQGDTAGAVDIRAATLEGSFVGLANALSNQQQQVSTAISATETLAGRIDTITRIAVMLVLPAFAFAIYRRRAKRSLQDARRRHDAQLEIERRSAAARDEFFAAVSHELRTPLTTILGFSELLVEGGVAPDESDEVIGIIRKDAIDLERRIDDLVATAPSASDSREAPTDTFEPGEAVNAAVRAASLDDVVVECEAALVIADSEAVTHIIRNLLSNAERHGGPSIGVTGQIIGDRYLISVADDGEGFDPQVIEGTGGPFAHDHREAILAGTIGLGLSAAAGLAHRCNASLAYRRVRGWTQVGLFIPLAESEAAPVPEPSPGEEALSA